MASQYKHNFEIIQGVDFALDVELYQADDITPINVTDLQASVNLRKAINQATPDLTMTIANGLIARANTNTLRLFFTKNGTANLIGKYYYEIDLIDAGGQTNTPIFGVIKVLGQATS